MAESHQAHGRWWCVAQGVAGDHRLEGERHPTAGGASAREKGKTCEDYLSVRSDSLPGVLREGVSRAGISDSLGLSHYRWLASGVRRGARYRFYPGIYFPDDGGV